MLSVTWHSHNNEVCGVGKWQGSPIMCRCGDLVTVWHIAHEVSAFSLCLGWGCGVCFKERGKGSRKRRGHTTSSISLCPLIVISRWVGMKIWSNSVCTTRSAPLGKVTQVATTPVITRSVIITKWKEAYRRSFDLFPPGKNNNQLQGKQKAGDIAAEIRSVAVSLYKSSDRRLSEGRDLYCTYYSET